MAAQSRGSVKGLGPAAERVVAGDRDGGLLFAFGQDLEQQLGAATVEFHVAEFVEAEQLDPAVAGDGAGQLPFVGGLDEFVDEFRREDVADPVAGLGGGGAGRTCSKSSPACCRGCGSSSKEDQQEAQPPADLPREPLLKAEPAVDVTAV